MNLLPRILKIIQWIFACLARLYPPAFREEMAEEMQVTFTDLVQEAATRGGIALGLAILRELRDLPGILLREYWLVLKRYGLRMIAGEGKDQMDINEQPVDVNVEKLSAGGALIGTLPYLVYGVFSSILFSTDLISWPIPYRETFLAFTVLVLVGLGVGLASGFPLWAYSYLGWALMITFDGVYHWGPSGGGLEMITGGGWRTWLPFGITLLAGLLWARSLEPLKNIFTGIWEDWTRLSLVLFAAGGWVVLIYDGKRPPYLAAYMLGSALVIGAGMWGFLHSKRAWVRGLALLASFYGAIVIIATSSWDWKSHYSFLKTFVTWHDNLGISYIAIFFWALFLLCPVLVELLRNLIRRNRTGKLTAA